MKTNILTIFLFLLILQLVNSIKWGECLLCGVVCAAVSGVNGKISEDACRPGLIIVLKKEKTKFKLCRIN